MEYLTDQEILICLGESGMDEDRIEETEITTPSKASRGRPCNHSPSEDGTRSQAEGRPTKEAPILESATPKSRNPRVLMV